MHTHAIMLRSLSMTWFRWALAISLVVPLMGSLFAAPAAAEPKSRGARPRAVTSVTSTVTSTVDAGPSPVADVVLYEVTEAVGSGSKGSSGGGSTSQVGFKSSVATLSGVARSGSAPCPLAVASEALQGCWVVVRATGRADDTTGIGPVVGSFEVVVQDKYVVDAPEIVVLRGNIGGEIDLSPAFQQGRPVGTITGTYTLRGVPGTVMSNQTIKGTFTGVFRLPYTSAGQPSYMTDGGSPTPVQPSEYVLGYPAVKLEVTLR